VSRLTDLIAQVKTEDAALGADLEAEFRVLSERRVFGLNFERHRPEAVELPQRPIRKGDKVRILPPRGSTKRSDQRLWRVLRTEAGEGNRVAHLTLLGGDEAKSVAADDLIVVAEFRDPIYPGLRSTGRVERGGDKPYHTVINAENYHALQTLLYTHRGKVDCIYIDPPYNTGAKDWKYNNDYVDSEDIYRHSKWLAFMERRLLLAEELLNPDDSVLIVTIDEKEVQRLGLLLKQIMPTAIIQMVSIVINPNGVARGAELARVEEYAYFCFFGKATPARLPDAMIDQGQTAQHSENVRWEWLLRGGANALRADRPNLFYPIFIDPIDKRIVEIGNPIPPGTERSTIPDRPGLTTLWPLKGGIQEARWRASAPYLRELLSQGFAKLGAYDRRTGQWAILYLGKAQLARIEKGELVVDGHDENGAANVVHGGTGRTVVPKTVWNRSRHSAGEHGTRLVNVMLQGRSFPFPKSLYAVEDALSVAVANRPDALILDFFGGTRRCISVTNNEVSAEEQGQLRRAGLRPGDPDWERQGICAFITEPRIRGAVTGQSLDGAPLTGSYRFVDEFPMAEGFEENVELFTLTYETPWRVARNRDFAAIAPLLWLRAGAQGRRIDAVSGAGWDVAETYGVLVGLDRTSTARRESLGG